MLLNDYFPRRILSGGSVDEAIRGTRRALYHSELTEQIIGAFYEVYSELGAGFLESVYETALSIALVERGLRVVRQAPIEVWFHGRRVGLFRADIVVESAVLLELKAARALESAHTAQLLNLLRATSVEVGL